MARIAAKHVMEQSCTEFAGADMSTELKLMGVDVASVGDAHAMTPNSLSYFYADEAAQVYKKIVVDAAKNSTAWRCAGGLRQKNITIYCK